MQRTISVEMIMRKFKVTFIFVCLFSFANCSNLIIKSKKNFATCFKQIWNILNILEYIYEEARKR